MKVTNLEDLKKETYRNLANVFVNGSHFHFNKKTIKTEHIKLINHEWVRRVDEHNCIVLHRFHGKDIAIDFQEGQVAVLVEENDNYYRCYCFVWYDFCKNKTEFQMVITKAITRIIAKEGQYD